MEMASMEQELALKQAEIDRLKAQSAAFTAWLDSELKDFAHVEYLATIERVRDKFLSLK